MFIFTPNKASRTDVGELRKMEREWNINWGELHGYRDRMQFPEIPRNMDPGIVRREVSDLCENFFDGVEKCLDLGRASEHPKRPFERLVGCKTHWFKFDRCVRKRDRKIMDTVSEWESEFAKKLAPSAAEEYLRNDVDRKVRFYQYLSDQASTQQKAVFYERHKGFMLDRGIAVRRALGVPLCAEELERERQVRQLGGKETDMAIIIKNITSRLQQPEKHRIDAPPS